MGEGEMAWPLSLVPRVGHSHVTPLQEAFTEEYTITSFVPLVSTQFITLPCFISNAWPAFKTPNFRDPWGANPH